MSYRSFVCYGVGFTPAPLVALGLHLAGVLEVTPLGVAMYGGLIAAGIGSILYGAIGMLQDKEQQS